MDINLPYIFDALCRIFSSVISIRVILFFSIFAGVFNTRRPSAGRSHKVQYGTYSNTVKSFPVYAAPKF
jgi:hypothetical protein